MQSTRRPAARSDSDKVPAFVHVFRRDNRRYCRNCAKLVSAYLFALVLSQPSLAEDSRLVQGELGERIADYVAQAHDAYGFTGAVLAAKEGKVQCAVGVGSLGDESETPIDTTTLFEIASATKPFTAITAQLLDEQEKLSLDESISKHLPGIPEDCRGITARHLIQHTSGIPGSNTRGRGDDFAVVVPSFLRGGPKHPPGTRKEYWNQGYSLLSEIIARASGQSYVDFTRQAIFGPADMRHSCFTGEEAPEGVTVAIGQSTNGRNRSALEPPYGPTYGYEYRGMGGIVTNVWDLWRFDRALAAGRLLDEDSLEQMTTPGKVGSGLGWTLARDKAGNRYHHHGGSVRGFLTDIYRFPAIDGCLFILSNSDNRTTFFQVATDCRQLLLDEKQSIELPRPLSPDFLTAITGNYVDAKKRKLTIEPSGKLARATIYWGGPITIALIGNDKQGNPHLFERSGKTPMTFEISGKRATNCKLLTLEFRQL